MRLWFFRRKKKGSREEAKKRLQTIISSSRRESLSMQNMVIPKEQFEKNSEVIKEKITAWVSETFNVDRSRVRVEFEEREGHVIIITNVSFH